MNKRNLIEIYRVASEYFYNNKQNSNQKSKCWVRYNSKEFTLDNLINFRNDKRLSEGLDDANNNFSFKIFSEIINLTSESFMMKNLPKKNIGNSKDLIPYKDVLLDFNKLIHIYWFWIVENRILKKDKINSICDIGGGFGSFSELFVKNYDTKIFLIDLPEANLMSAYYLKELFPQKSFYLFDDYKKNDFLSKSDFDKNDMIILPPNCNVDKKIKIDFFINTRSMMEMNYEIIKSYFNFIQEHLDDGGYFLNINRYQKIGVGYPIRISEYPYDNYWKVLISEPSFNQNKIHFLLTQRTFDNNESNIIQELDNIKNIGKKFIYKPRFIVFKKILKLIFGVKFLNFIGSFLFKISEKLKNFK